MPRIAHLLVALTAFALLPVPARAQTDDWSGFKPPPPPPTVPVDNSTAAPAPTPATAPATAPAAKPAEKAASPGYVPPATVPVATPAAAAAPKDAAPASETVKESVLPGSEPHDPGTYDNAAVAQENTRVGSSVSGATGLLRLGSADLGKPGVLRVSLNGEYYTGSDFPVLTARDTRMAGTLAVDWTIIKWVEVYLSYTTSANTNSESSPPLLQAQGDVRLGVKAAVEAVKGFYVGADVQGIMFPGVGAQDVRNYAFGIAPKLLLTFDAHRYVSKLPLRLHVNLGGIFDSSESLVDTAAHQPTPAEEFALGLQKYNRLSFGAGLEVPVPFVTPFLEYGFAFPFIGSDTLKGPDLKEVSALDSMPQQLAIGVKVTALRDVTLQLAFEIGLTRYVALGVPATAPYNFVFGLSYAFDPMGKGTSKLVEKTVTLEKKVEVVKAPPIYTGKVAGQVVDADTKQPIAGAVVTVAGSGLPPVATDVDGGKYLTHELAAGKISLTFARDGYKPVALDATVDAGATAQLDAQLTRDIKPTPVKVLLRSNGAKASGKVAFSGVKAAELTVPAEGATIELPKGHYAAAVDAEAFLSKVQEVDVPETGLVTLSIELVLKPKQSLVVIKDDRIQIKQQVHFATGKATILNDSFQLLDQVVDAILRANIKKLRVEGHTDNQGVKDANLKLSNDRAASVVEYLIKKGLDKSRLVSEGYGDTKPIAPNLTAKGRELNRRVEFMIVDR